MLRRSVCLVQSWFENWVGSSSWCVSQPFSSLTELATWGLGWKPPLVCDGERVFRLKAWLLSNFRGVALESRMLALGSLPPLQPPADLGCAWLHRRDPFSCILLFRGADKWLPLSSYFLVVVIFHCILWPVPIITFHTCLPPFFLWASSTLQANSYYYCPLNSDGKTESYRIKAVTVVVKVRLPDSQASSQPHERPEGAPWPRPGL